MAFRLARVLRLRTQLRERAAEEVGRAREALAAARERLAEARALEDGTIAAEAAAMGRGSTGGEVRRFRRFAGATRARETGLAAEAARLASELVARREVLLGLRRDERQLEILRERARERSEAEMQRAAAVLLDELMMRRR